MPQWGGIAMFSKKVWVSVVWAAFRERNFEVGEPFLRARSVPSKYYFFRTYASAKHIFFIKSHISPLFLLRFPFVNGLGKYLPPLHSTKKNRILLVHMRFFHYLCGAIYSIVFTMRTTITILPATMEHKSCPRCGAAFICQHENPAKCQCAGVELSPATRAHLAAQYPNQCLCRKCLLEFSI